MRLVESGHRLSLLDHQKVAERPSWLTPRAVFIARYLNTHPGSSFADIQIEAEHLFPEENGKHLHGCHGSPCRCYDLARKAFPPLSDDERTRNPGPTTALYFLAALAIGAGIFWLALL